jgi:hypothetical protein
VLLRLCYLALTGMVMVTLLRFTAERELLGCVKLGEARSLIPVGQIARVSSSKTAGTRRFTVSSVPSS